MNRRLGPEETKYWLLGQVYPFNIVLAAGMTGWRTPSRIALPTIALEAGLPRWTAASDDGLVTELPGSWIETATAMLGEPVGVAGAPAWRLSVVDDGGETVVLLALPHALADARGGLVLLQHLVAGIGMPVQPPSFEELLPDDAFANPSIQADVLGWWSRKLTLQIGALDLPALARSLPARAQAPIGVHWLDTAPFARLRERCRLEQTTLHGAIVAALTEGDAGTALGHAIDMRRFLPAPFADEAWLALSHLRTGWPGPGPFWRRAREARDDVVAAMASGDAATALAELPRTLASSRLQPTAAPPLTISNGGRAMLPSGPNGRATWYMAVAGSNAGAPVLSVSGAGERLMLASTRPTDLPLIALEEVACRLEHAASA